MDTRHPVLTIPSTFAVFSSRANSAALLCRRIQDRRLERLAVGGARVARREGAASVAPPEVDRGSASFLPCFSLEHVCRQDSFAVRPSALRLHVFNCLWLWCSTCSRLRDRGAGSSFQPPCSLVCGSPSWRGAIVCSRRVAHSFTCNPLAISVFGNGVRRSTTRRYRSVFFQRPRMRLNARAELLLLARVCCMSGPTLSARCTSTSWNP